MRYTAFTFLAAVICLAPGRGQDAEARKATIEYLRSLQTRDGGFVTAAGVDQPSLRATSSALRALKYCGGQPRDREGCIRFVRGCFDDATGGFTDRPGVGKPDVVTTAVGIMAVVELKLPPEKLAGPVTEYLDRNAKTFEDIRIAAAGLESIGKRPSQVDSWLDLLARMRSKDGAFGEGDGKARATGGAVVAELRLGPRLDSERRKVVLKAIKDGQQEDGGFAKEGAKTSDLETSYRVMRAFHMLDELPDAKKLRTFVARCRNDDGGYGLAPGQKSSVSGTYFASIIFPWLRGK